MNPEVTERYHRAHAAAVAKGADMPNWMLRRSACHSVRMALSNPYVATDAMQEAAWGSADGFADEIRRRHGHI